MMLERKKKKEREKSEAWKDGHTKMLELNVN